MNAKIIIAAFALLLCSLAYSYNEGDLLRDTLAPYGIDVKDVGVTDEGAFLKYEQKPTSSPMAVHASNVIAMAALADEFPNESMVFVFTLAGGKPIMVSTAKTSDVLAYSSGEMTPEEFSDKVYAKLLVEERSSACCIPAAILLLVPGALALAKFSKKQ